MSTPETESPADPADDPFTVPVTAEELSLVPVHEPNSLPQAPERRLYVPLEGWQARVKTDWEKEYCHLKAPGEDYFHLLMNGEIFLYWGNQRICLNCALRNDIATSDRLFWQRGHKKLN